MNVSFVKKSFLLVFKGRRKKFMTFFCCCFDDDLNVCHHVSLASTIWYLLIYECCLMCENNRSWRNKKKEGLRWCTLRIFCQASGGCVPGWRNFVDSVYFINFRLFLGKRCYRCKLESQQPGTTFCQVSLKIFFYCSMSPLMFKFLLTLLILIALRWSRSSFFLFTITCFEVVFVYFEVGKTFWRQCIDCDRPFRLKSCSIPILFFLSVFVWNTLILSVPYSIKFSLYSLNFTTIDKIFSNTQKKSFMEASKLHTWTMNLG